MSEGHDPNISLDDLLAHGEHADGEHDVDVFELADVPAQEVILRAIMVMMSAAAEKLGLSSDDPSSSPKLDLDEARRLIDALAGLVAGSAEYLGPQANTIRNGLQGLQHAFRESSSHPDAPGQGPGEKFTGKLY